MGARRPSRPPSLKGRVPKIRTGAACSLQQPTACRPQLAASNLQPTASSLQPATCRKIIPNQPLLV